MQNSLLPKMRFRMASKLTGGGDSSLWTKMKVVGQGLKPLNQSVTPQSGKQKPPTLPTNPFLAQAYQREFARRGLPFAPPTKVANSSPQEKLAWLGRAASAVGKFFSKTPRVLDTMHATR